MGQEVGAFAIGQADRRASASLERATKIDDIPEQFARHVESVIAGDTLGVVPEEINEVMPVGTPDYIQRYMARREAYDAPMTDWRLDKNSRVFSSSSFRPAAISA